MLVILSDLHARRSLVDGAALLELLPNFRRGYMSDRVNYDANVLSLLAQAVLGPVR